jgi:prevent-host-death family protein
MALTVPLPQAGNHLSELVDHARRGHERVVLTDQGEPAAVLISVDELDELQRTQDEADIALCVAIKARNEPGIPHEEFMAALDAEDAGPSPA